MLVAPAPALVLPTPPEELELTRLESRSELFMPGDEERVSDPPLTVELP